ncbi:MAG: fatty acid desaturase family protein [Acidimicrobiales bacterium]
MVATMLPDARWLPDVLPTERLNEGGKPVPAIRDDLRRIPNARNAISVLGAWAQSFGVVALAGYLNRWWLYPIAFLLAGRGFGLLSILGHEAAHRLLFKRRRLNDGVGRWLLAYPSFTPLDLYRRAHMAHHRDEMGPNEPDLGLYQGYPITRASMKRKLTRDAFFMSGWKVLKPLLKAMRNTSSRGLAVRIFGAQAVIAVVLGFIGPWWLYPALWLAPWMSVWRVINRLRAVAEHGGMTRSDDRRLTTHHVRQRPWARFWMVPYNTGWHLAHHVDMGIPFRRLPRMHAELVRSGWFVPELEYPSYTALWRALASG